MDFIHTQITQLLSSQLSLINTESSLSKPRDANRNVSETLNSISQLSTMTRKRGLHKLNMEITGSDQCRRTCEIPALDVPGSSSHVT